MSEKPDQQISNLRRRLNFIIKENETLKREVAELKKSHFDLVEVVINMDKKNDENKVPSLTRPGISPSLKNFPDQLIAYSPMAMNHDSIKKESVPTTVPTTDKVVFFLQNIFLPLDTNVIQNELTINVRDNIKVVIGDLNQAFKLATGGILLISIPLIAVNQEISPFYMRDLCEAARQFNVKIVAVPLNKGTCSSIIVSKSISLPNSERKVPIVHLWYDDSRLSFQANAASYDTLQKMIKERVSE